MDVPVHRWTWPARCTRVVDGDTIVVEIDVGFSAVRAERLRLLNVDTPEVFGATKVAGLAASAWTRDWITAAGTADFPLLIETFRPKERDSFGRYLCLAWRTIDGRQLNADILDYLAAQAVVTP